jgi:hypothetical protein
MAYSSEACRIVNKLLNLIAQFVVVFELGAKVFAAVVFINNSVAAIVEKVVVCDNVNRKERVALKYKGTR